MAIQNKQGMGSWTLHHASDPNDTFKGSIAMTALTIPSFNLKYQETKECSKCKETKAVDCFYISRKSKTGYTSYCKTCSDVASRLWKELKPETTILYNKKSNLKNRDKIKEYQKTKKFKTKNKITQRNYREKNSEIIKLKMQAYRACDGQKLRNKKYNTKRRSILKNRLSNSISNSIRSSIKKGSKKHIKWEILVGYSLDKLKKHLERQFTQGMSWDNYGEWHIDHIDPVSIFNFNCPEDIDFKRCWNIKNLRPLWALDNIKKHAKLIRHFQKTLI